MTKIVLKSGSVIRFFKYFFCWIELLQINNVHFVQYLKQVFRILSDLLSDLTKKWPDETRKLPDQSRKWPDPSRKWPDPTFKNPLQIQHILKIYFLLTALQVYVYIWSIPKACFRVVRWMWTVWRWAWPTSAPTRSTWTLCSGKMIESRCKRRIFFKTKYGFRCFKALYRQMLNR